MYSGAMEYAFLFIMRGMISVLIVTTVTGLVLPLICVGISILVVDLQERLEGLLGQKNDPMPVKKKVKLFLKTTGMMMVFFFLTKIMHFIEFLDVFGVLDEEDEEFAEE